MPVASECRMHVWKAAPARSQVFVKNRPQRMTVPNDYNYIATFYACSRRLANKQVFQVCLLSMCSI